MANNEAVFILANIESNNKIISEYVMDCKEREKKLSFLSKALALRIAGPKYRVFQMLTPNINKSNTYSQKINSEGTQKQ